MLVDTSIHKGKVLSTIKQHGDIEVVSEISSCLKILSKDHASKVYK